MGKGSQPDTTEAETVAVVEGCCAVPGGVKVTVAQLQHTCCTDVGEGEGGEGGGGGGGRGHGSMCMEGAAPS
jgi:hypothetical protein